MKSLPGSNSREDTKTRRFWQNMPVFGAISISLLVSVTGFYLTRDHEQQRRQSIFQQASEDRVRVVEGRIKSALQVLHSLTAFYAASQAVDRQEFDRFFATQDIGATIQALEWIPRVSSADREQFELTARQDGFPDFQFTERDSSREIVPAAERDTYYPVYFLHPYAGNEAALGFDLGSNAKRLAALSRSRDSGEMVATARIKLFQETGSRYGFAVFVPLYKKDQPQTTLAERREYLIGFGLGVFRIGGLIKSAIDEGSLATSNVALRLLDRSAPPESQLLYSTASDSEDEVSDRPLLRYAKNLEVAGRNWRVEVVALSDSLHTAFAWQSWIVLVAGFLITGLLALYLQQTAGRTALVRALVEERTAELRAKTHELAHSNRELEQFAYVASHDLKAPLRGVDSLVKWIEEDLTDVLNEDTRTHIALLRARVTRLNGLLDDLLSYSRVGRLENSREMVDVKRLIDDILEVAPPPCGVSVSARGDLPVFETQKAPLEQVLRNLIGNAVKHHEPDGGRVEVSSLDAVDGYEFTVADDGPGIEPRFREKVFQMFQTLRPRDEVEGSGMGLAIVKKLIEHQGGKVRLGPGLDSKGVAFHFDWKKTNDKGTA